MRSCFRSVFSGSRAPRRAIGARCNRRLRVEPLEARQLLSVTLNPLGSYASGIFDGSAAEIVSHDPGTQRLFVTNAEEQTVDVLDISDPTNPVKAAGIDPIDVSGIGDTPTSVSVYDGLVAISVKIEDPESDPGVVAFYNTSGEPILDDANNPIVIQVGACPDMLTFTPDGTKVLVANEGQPDGDVDPNGSVSIIDVGTMTVKTVSFTHFNGKENSLGKKGVFLFDPDATVAENLEPEYIAVHPNSNVAWVVLQENNAIAKINLNSGTVSMITGLGYKDHSLEGNGFDPSNKDGGINIANWPVYGMFQPDGMAAYTASDGETYLVTANEGDAANDDERIKDVTLDPEAFPDAEMLQDQANLGRLKISTMMGDTDGDGDIDELYAYGTRSFSIFTPGGELVFDSGDDFEQITADILGDDFNSTNKENDSGDSRSDDKGPEPEYVVIGEVGDRTYAFIGLERVGGVMVYDVTDPYNASFESYINTRDFSVPIEIPLLDEDGDPVLDEDGDEVMVLNPDWQEVGDLGPEGMKFIPADESPLANTALLVMANEVSGTTTIFEITDVSMIGAVPTPAVSESPHDAALQGGIDMTDLDPFFGKMKKERSGKAGSAAAVVDALMATYL